jgi:hypothetical protein
MLSILKAGKVPDQAAAWAVDLIPLFVTATAFEESVQSASAWTTEDLDRYLAEMRGFFAGLPAEKFPIVVALAGALTSGAQGDERFEFGVQVIVAGLASLAES